MLPVFVGRPEASGLADSQAGRTTGVETVRADFGLEK
jgi:hypothetical protein